MATTPQQASKQPRKAAARAKQPAKPTMIRRIGGDLYWVSSASHPGTGHQVTPQSCTCPAARHGRPDCRHRALVRLYHAWRTEQAAPQQAAPQQAPTSEAPQGTACAPRRSLAGYFE